MVPTEDKVIVIEAIVKILTKKKSKRKMTSLYAILKQLREDKISISKIQVESAIDVLIQSGFIRYWIKEFEDKKYTYYGISMKGWKKWGELQKGL